MNSNSPRTLSKLEFVCLMGGLMSLVALAIDAVLPAFEPIATSLSVESHNHVQWVISVLFAGFVIGQLLFGPMSDAFGRRWSILMGLGLFTIGSLIGLFSLSFEQLLLARFLQGTGAAASRVTCVAIIRDRMSGADMASMMSYVMAIFIFAPVIAPSIGELILSFSGWRSIFVFYLIFAFAMACWVLLRLEETLDHQRRTALSWRAVAKNFAHVFSNKQTMGYTLAAGIVFGALVGYLNSAQQTFQHFFDTGGQFAIYFGISAFSVGISSIVNGRFVKAFGINRICTLAMIGILCISGGFYALFDLTEPQGLLLPYMVTACGIFFCYGLLFGNLNSLTMEHMNMSAGTASAVIGCLSTAIGLVIGTVIGQLYDDSLRPLMLGFIFVGVSTLILHRLLMPKSHPL